MEVAGRLIEAGASVNLQNTVRRAGRDGQGGRVWLEGRGNGGLYYLCFAGNRSRLRTSTRNANTSIKDNGNRNGNRNRKRNSSAPPPKPLSNQ